MRIYKISTSMRRL